MAERTGYNIARIKELMTNIEQCYNNLGSTIQTGWENMSATLRREWVGEDEQDFETKLGERISSMFVNTYDLANNSLTTIYDLAKAWYDFQNKNTLTGADAVGSVTFGLEPVTLTKNDKIINVVLTTIGDDVDRGLVNGNSAEVIKQALVDYKASIQSKINEMIESVTVDTAFFGSQSYNIKWFVEQVGTAMGEVLSAIKDMHDALDVLANSSYTKASESVGGNIYNAGHTLNSSLNDLGESRWT